MDHPFRYSDTALETQKMNFKEKLFGFIPLGWRYDLTGFSGIRSLLKSRWVPFLFIVISLFLNTVALLSGFLGGFSAGNYNFGVTMVWILWWGALMVFMVPFFSRIWCAVCPFPLFGEWAQRGKLVGVGRRLSGLQKRWPKSLKNMWLMNVLFLVTSLGGGFFTVSPFWTFVVLGAMFVLATMSMFIWEKRTFCLYICPVSGFQGLYANLSMCEVRRKDPEVCRGHKQKTCVLGNENGYGCPWGLLPYRFEKNTYCGICLECFKTCPYDNMVLNLRPPGGDLLIDEQRGLDEAWKAFIMLGVAISFFLVFQGPYGFLKDWARARTASGYLSFITLHISTAAFLIPLTHLVFTYLSKVSSGDKEVSLKKIFVNFSYVLVPFGLAVWVAFSFGILLPNGSYILHVISDPFGLGWNVFGTANVPWRPVLTLYLQPLKGITIIGGLLFSMDTGYKIASQTYTTGTARKRGIVPLFVYLMLLSVFFLWLLAG